VVHAAERGVGIALVSAPVCAPRLSAGTLRQVGHAELTTGESYLVVTRRDDLMRSEVQRLVEWLSRHFGRKDGVESENRAIGA
jgi:DNA-binding transcriptional LysR family regulator